MSRNHIPAVVAIVVVTVAFVLAAIGMSSATDPVHLTQAQVKTCTTDPNGYCTVTHSLGAVPEAVVVTPLISQGYLDYHLSAVYGQMTATSVKVRAMRTDSSPRANLPITFSMVVYGTQATPPPTTTTAPVITTTAPPPPPTITTTTAVTTTPPPPPATGFPDAITTGVPAGTQLTVVTGDQRIDVPGTVWDGKDVRGCVEVHAVNVVIRNSKISCVGFYVILAHTDASLTLEDSEVDCQDTRRTAVGDTNLTVRRVNIHGCENGFDLDGNVVIEDSYVHDLYSDDIAHTDGAQLTDIAHNITIRHNTIYSRTSDGLDGVDGTSSIISPRVTAGVATNVLIEGNLFGGGAYTLYCPQAGPGNNFRVINNHFSTRWHPTVGFYGPWTDCQDEAQVTGNVYHESGLPVPF